MNRFVVVTGPTATGKSDVALSLAEAFSGEIVCMDSMQIYRGFVIGTAAPSGSDRARVPHHLFGFADANTPYSVAMYQQDALRVMGEICARNHLPIFVGGTGLYLQALLHPLSFADAEPDLALREQLQAQDPCILIEKLRELDPETAAKLPPGDTRRIIRALEICLTTGAPASLRRHDWDAPSDQKVLVLGLTLERAKLVERISERVIRMFEQGLVEEVQGLLQSGIEPTCQAMQAIGYREIIENPSIPEAMEAIVIHTRQYAKRQMTWFRRTPPIEWFDAATANLSAQLWERVQRFC